MALLILLYLGIIIPAAVSQDAPAGGQPGNYSGSTTRISPAQTSSLNFQDLTNGEADQLKARMQSDINEYESMKKRILIIREHLRRHADFHLIDEDLLKSAKLTVEELERTIVVPLERHLVAVREQVSRLNHSLAADEKTFILELLENSEKFLDTSKTRLMSLEISDKDWISDEKVEQIRQELQHKLDEKSRKVDSNSSNGESSSLAGPRGQRLGQMKNLRKSIYEKKMKMLEDFRNRHSTSTQSPKVERVDLRRVKEELDRERFMDQHPGYDKKIKLAMAAAAEQSHQFIREKLAQAHNERAGLMMAVILLVLFLVIMSAAVVFRKRKRAAAARKNCQGLVSEEGILATSEMNDMGRYHQGHSNNGLANPWSEVWTTWESDTRRSKESQKLK